MTFDHPLFLWLLLLAPLDALLALRREAKLRASLLALVGPGERGGIARSRAILAPLAAISGALFIASTSLALSAPGWGRTSSLVERNGLEIALVVDVSRSMLAEDLPPQAPGGSGSRLSAALAFSRLAMTKAPGAAFSLVATKGSGLLLVPMTDDFDALETGLDWAGPGAMSEAGTDLGSGIDRALSSFSPLAGQGKLILLLSDGGDLSGRARAAALRAREGGARIIAVGFGGTTPVTVPGEDGRPIGDGSGGLLHVAQDAGTLRAIAEATGGRYVDSSEASALPIVSEEIAREGKSGFRVQERPRDRTVVFAGLAFAALLLRFSSAFFSMGGLRRHTVPQGGRR
ncbi:MAG TPA: VWA domain-containing protein [Rectinemataceae bacterium]|nr:VWA domain-containing protein [Rectinemataceae bacterium]